MLQHARELLAVRSPLDAELIVSEILGSWWGHHVPGGDVEEVIGEALVDYAGRAGTPAALALLTGMAYLGTSRQAAKAERAALELMERGVARPGWADRVGMVAPEECYVSRDVYGDQDSIVCTYTYGGTERHALVVLVDRNRAGAVQHAVAPFVPAARGGRPPTSGMVRDAWVSSQVGKLLDHCRREGRDNPLMRFEQLDPRDTKALLQSALGLTDDTDDPPVNENFGSYHAFVRARMSILPPGGRLPQPPVYGRDRRATIAARFLASDEAEGLSDRSAASRCVDRIIDYGCTHDFGRPLRVSPIKCEMFLLDWLPRKVLLSPTEQEAVPHVLASWVRWAGKRTGLPEEGIRATLDAVWDATGKFAEAYRDPSAFGLDRDLVDRLLPDGELDALPRRAFALPFLSGTHRQTGRHGAIDLSTLDPADPDDRRIILEFEHPGADAGHLDAHERLAERLWNGDPPQLWETAQALLDVGYERHEILHRLIDVLDRHEADPEALREALRVLRHEPPPE
ncbi:hypothetical protein AGRA3207_001613 [Actinomadura graeca]|uniref:Uncharacterized protein n=1 Tax=Actinomadura graeca TaxID=2750812 RepID=A0ABX8R5P6_9ACTN|nr:hypothetical protein [Actinomadura graeca]QXJ26402.1 hypothetical protein AGRA3207_001613 [Actinomadura graeca]